MEIITQYRVFIASPSGLEEVREVLRAELRDYNGIDANQRGVSFLAVGWEDVLGGAGRPQSLINDDLKKCDVFILVLRDRWGSRPDTEGPYTSGCQEEFEEALKCLEDPKLPMADILVFFGSVDPARLADPGPQLSQVLQFRAELEKSKKHFHFLFDSVEMLKKRLRQHLAAWVYRHEKEQSLGPSAPEQSPLGPDESPLETSSLAIKNAQHLADEGNLTGAEIAFAKLSIGRPNPEALQRYGQFLMRTGRFELARLMHERVVDLSSEVGERWKAAAFSSLGKIYRERGELVRAEEKLNQALDIYERLNSKEGKGYPYVELGVIAITRGELVRAEEKLNQALGIFVNQAQPIGEAKTHLNLGIVYRERGELVRAEEKQNQALEIFERLGHQEGMASSYGNLGNIFLDRREYGDAKNMFLESLRINQTLGYRAGIAKAYGSLGNIYNEQGRFDDARKEYLKSLDIDRELGRREGMAVSYENLGEVYKSLGKLDLAEEALLKALEVSEHLRFRNGLITSYTTLGKVYKSLGKLDRAEEALLKAMEIKEGPS